MKRTTTRNEPKPKNKQRTVSVNQSTNRNIVEPTIPSTRQGGLISDSVQTARDLLQYLSVTLNVTLGVHDDETTIVTPRRHLQFAVGQYHAIPLAGCTRTSTIHDTNSVCTTLDSECYDARGRLIKARFFGTNICATYKWHPEMNWPLSVVIKQTIGASTPYIIQKSVYEYLTKKPKLDLAKRRTPKVLVAHEHMQFIMDARNVIEWRYVKRDHTKRVVENLRAELRYENQSLVSICWYTGNSPCAFYRMTLNPNGVIRQTIDARGNGNASKTSQLSVTKYVYDINTGMLKAVETVRTSKDRAVAKETIRYAITINKKPRASTAHTA